MQLQRSKSLLNIKDDNTFIVYFDSMCDVRLRRKLQSIKYEKLKTADGLGLLF